MLLHAVILKLSGKMETQSHLLHPDKIEADKATFVAVIEKLLAKLFVCLFILAV